MNRDPPRFKAVTYRIAARLKSALTPRREHVIEEKNSSSQDRLPASYSPGPASPAGCPRPRQPLTVLGSGNSGSLRSSLLLLSPQPQVLCRGDEGAALPTNLLSKTLSELFQNIAPAPNHTLQWPVPKFTFCYFRIKEDMNENLFFLLSQSPASFTGCSSPSMSFSDSRSALTSFRTSGDALNVLRYLTFPPSSPQRFLHILHHFYSFSLHVLSHTF